MGNTRRDGQKLVRLETDLSETEGEDFRTICEMAGESRRKMAGALVREFLAQHRRTLDQFRAAKANIRADVGLQRRARRTDPTGTPERSPGTTSDRTT